LYDELLHVPLIFKLPDSQYGGKIITKTVGLIQVVPTILDILGIHTNQSFDGKSLLPLIERNDEKPIHDFIISEARLMDKCKASIRNEEWKLIVDVSKQKRELYNLKRDAREQCNVHEENPSISLQLETELMERLSIFKANKNRSELLAENVDEEILDRLKDLGYL
jgi:arylsulfatase A-like enzyme